MKNKFLLVCSYVERENSYLYFIDPSTLSEEIEKGNVVTGDIVSVSSRTYGASLMKVEFILDLDKVGKEILISLKRHDYYGSYAGCSERVREYDVYLLKINTSKEVIYRDVRCTLPMNKTLGFVKHDLSCLLRKKYEELYDINLKKEKLKEEVDDAIRSDDSSLNEFKEKYREVLNAIKTKQEEINLIEEKIEEEKPQTSEEFIEFFDAIQKEKYGI